MPKKKIELETDLLEVPDDQFVSAEELAEEEGAEPEEAPKEIKPEMDSPEWSKYVMTKFAEGECDEKGNPKVAGLRRVARLLLGPIISSKVNVVQAPCFHESGLMQPAVVEYTVKFRFYDDEVEFSDAADCYHKNVDPEFGRYLTATASTRAEARVLRKALQLNTVAAEEVSKTEPDALDAMTSGNITDSQIVFIDNLCKRIDVNAWGFINCGKTKYGSIRDISFFTAQQMNECLSNWQNNPNLIRVDLKGYDPNWRK